MANSEVINKIIECTTDMFTYMMPVLALMTGIIFIASYLYSITIGAVKRI